MMLRAPFLLAISGWALIVGCGSINSTPDGGGGGAGGGVNGGCEPGTDLMTNPFHCGGCGVSCQFPNALADCRRGVCAVKGCAPNFRDLDGEAANGCEASCTPLVVSATGNLDFDVKVITVSGRVTMGGQSAPVGDPRGLLRFELSGSKPIDVTLPTAGEATFSARLFAGQYRVLFIKAGDCRAGALPCGTQVVRKGMLTASGALDFDVVGAAAASPITITGLVTANGQPLGLGARGSVQFASDAGVVTSILPASGSANFNVVLSPGAYDVRLEGAVGCPADTVLPCQRSVRKRGVQLTTSGNLDLDLPIVQVSGSVTVNGSPLAGAAAERGRLRLVDVTGEGPFVSLGTTGAAQWSTLVYSGPHDVLVSSTTCATGGLPCQSLTAKRAVALTAPGSLDLDLKVLEINGRVLANGQQLASSPKGVSRGTASFRSGASGPSVDLGSSGPATFLLRLYEGSYDVVIANAADCPDGPLPCGSKTVKTMALSASGALDVDVPVIAVSGVVTANGAGIPAAAVSRGMLTFEGPSLVPVALTGAGAASWNASLYPGTYQIVMTNQVNCAAATIPCQTYTVDAARSLTVPGSLTIDLPVADITGSVTLNGQAVAASPNPRGELLFKAPALGTVAASVGSTGTASYQARLYRSSYQVLFRNLLDCSGGQPLPCQGEAELEPAAQFTASGSKDFDLKAFTLSGVVQVNSLPMGPSGSAQSRGALRFATYGAASVSKSILATGPASYQLQLLQGRYDVGIENVADCSAGSPLPCQKQVIAGCIAPEATP